MKTQDGKLALHGGKPVRAADKKWPAWPQFDHRERKALNKVLESGKWWYGERVAQFEKDYAAFQDAKFCVTCTSGTAALEICLQALGIGSGDEVIVPPFTFIATASAVLRVGAMPVFADVDDSWNLAPGKIEDATTPRTKAIIPVHFGGRVCDMDRINAIAKKRGLAVIEDACHSWGSKWKGKGTGALGRCGVFSFQVSKNITAGEGGAILTDDEALADECRSITNCGRAKESAWYGHAILGTNARLTEFQAAILSAQLSRLEKQTIRREKNAAILNEALSRIDGLTPQPGDPRITRRAYHLYCFRIAPDAFGCSREQFLKAAQAEGLPVGAGYALPLYKQPVFQRRRGARLRGLKGTVDYAACRCPVAEDLCYRSAMWFPHQVLLGTQADMRDIIATVIKMKKHAAKLRR